MITPSIADSRARGSGPVPAAGYKVDISRG